MKTNQLLGIREFGISNYKAFIFTINPQFFGEIKLDSPWLEIS